MLQMQIITIMQDSDNMKSFCPFDFCFFSMTVMYMISLPTLVFECFRTIIALIAIIAMCSFKMISGAVFAFISFQTNSALIKSSGLMKEYILFNFSKFLFPSQFCKAKMTET